MKPFRGKRRGPQSPPVGFSLPAARRPRRSASARSPARSSLVRRWAHFRRAERYDRFAGGHKPSGKVTGLSRDRRYSPGRRRPAGGPWKTRCATGRGRVASGVRSTCGDCCQCPQTAGVRRRRGAAIGSGSVANRSVACPTRLETRTKESNMCASQWVLRNPEAQ